MIRAVLNICNHNVLPMINKQFKRQAKTTVCAAGDSELKCTEKSMVDARPPEEIPGPKPLPFVGNVFRFFPYIGEYGNLQIIQQFATFREQYGDIVRLTGIPNRRPTVILFNPQLIENMYRQEGQWPLRIALESLARYCESRESIYKGQSGLIASQGKDWYDFRSKVNPHMMQPRSIVPHIPQTDSVTQDFIEKIKNELRDPVTLELPPQFYQELNKWALESICLIAVDHRMGCLKSNLSNNSEPHLMINCVQKLFNHLYYLELVPMWKVVNAIRLKKLFHVLDDIYGIMIKYVRAAKEKLDAESKSDQPRNRSILEKILNVDAHVATVMALDMVTAGIDTTSNASGSFLYHLATNQKVQNKLREEAYSVLPYKSSPVTEDVLKHAPYLKACFKENMRMSPISVGTVRSMPTNIVIGGYRIPAGWAVMPCHGILAQDEDQFTHAKEFIPERWIRNNEEFTSNVNAHPFTYMPFGFGPRSCVGRRIAEMEIQILVLKMVRNFQIEWHHEPLKYKSYLINTIASPMKFKLIDV